MKEVVFTVNGPGELNGIVFPLTKAFRANFKNLIFTLFVVPCQFGSGLEVEVAKASGLFAQVFSIKDYQQLWLKKKLPEGYQPQAQGILFYAGGDGYHAIKIAAKLKYDAYAYVDNWQALSFKAKFKKIFIPEIVGNLMVDAAWEKKIRYQAEPIGSAKITLGLYPGSRPNHLKYLAPFLSEVATQLKNKYPQLNIRWGINDNLKKLFEEKYQSICFAAPYESEDTSYDLVISLTGTNTGINGALGIPMLVLLPFNWPELVPLMGLFGLLSEIPFLGRLLKLAALKYFEKKRVHKFIALPNIKARRPLVPELVGFITPTQVALQAENILLSIKDREEMHAQLPIFMGERGAAQNIVESFREILA